MNKLHKFYTKENETFDDALKRVSIAFSGGDDALAKRLYEYSRRGWFMYASPLFNAPADGNWKKAMPISCFGNFVEDTIQGLCDHSTETRWMSVAGGGVGGYWGNVRSVDDKAPGPIPFIHTIDADVIAYKQGSTRRAAYAAYMDYNHPDIMEFLNIRMPTGGDESRKAFNIHHAVNIDHAFINAVLGDEDIDLVDPNDKTIRGVLPARNLWERILETRYRTGEPYIVHIGEANKHLHPSLKEKGLRIHHSNLCSEIMLPSDRTRSFVCCLSSVNVEHYEDWRGADLIADLITMLNNALDIFICKAPQELHKAVFSAMQERSIGLGAMGFHSYLQKNGIALGSVAAQNINEDIFSTIWDQAQAQSYRLSKKYSHFPDGRSGDNYNAHLIAIAPNANSALLLDTSPGIEPIMSNYYTQYTRAGAITHKNKYLRIALRGYGLDTPEIWERIASNKGSVQDIEEIPLHIRNVFKTAFEEDQNVIVRLARDRQKYIDQAQSVNLFFNNKASRSYVNQVHLNAFREDLPGQPLKSLYYLRTKSGEDTEYVSNKIECVGCD